MRLSRALIPALAASALLAGCTSGKINTAPVPTPTAASSAGSSTGNSAGSPAPAPSGSAPAPVAPPPATTAPASGPAQAQVGDALDLTGSDTGSRMEVTVTRVVDPAAAADEFSTPDPGDRFVSVQFRLQDVGSAVYTDAPSNGAEIIDSTGQGYNASFDDSAAGPQFPAPEHIAPGDSALGFVTFQVPNGVRVAKVQFTLDSGFADDTGQWNVNTTVAGAAPPAAPQTGQPPRTSTAPAPTASPSADPAQTVQSYFADINARDFNAAWNLGGKNLDSSYQHFSAGFADTVEDTVNVTGVNGDTVSVTLDALQSDGSHQDFSGTYTVRNGVIVAASIS